MIAPAALARDRPEQDPNRFNHDKENVLRCSNIRHFVFGSLSRSSSVGASSGSARVFMRGFYGRAPAERRLRSGWCTSVPGGRRSRLEPGRVAGAVVDRDREGEKRKARVHEDRGRGSRGRARGRENVVDLEPLAWAPRALDRPEVVPGGVADEERDDGRAVVRVEGSGVHAEARVTPETGEADERRLGAMFMAAL